MVGAIDLQHCHAGWVGEANGREGEKLPRSWDRKRQEEGGGFKNKSKMGGELQREGERPRKEGAPGGGRREARRRGGRA